MKKLLNPIVVVGLALSGPLAHAWGPDGHHTVGSIAEQLIAGTHAAREVQTILAGLSLTDAAVWADCAKGVNVTTFQYQNAGKYPECRIFETADGEAAMVDFVRRNASNCIIKPGQEVCHKQYHYSDIAIQHMTYDSVFVGARNDDIVAAVVAVTHVLKGQPAPPPFNIKDRSEALKLLAHYVGDIHQPLHVGAIYLDASGHVVNPDQGAFDPATDTRGGNNITVLAAGTNLHATWDEVPASLSPANVNAAWIAAARAVARSRGSELEWAPQWASESVVQADLAFQGLKFGPLENARWTVRLPVTYPGRMNAIKQRQLTRAGARLAQLLQSIWP